MEKVINSGSIDINLLNKEIEKIENELKLGLMLKQKKYTESRCLEEMLDWYRMDFNIYTSMHEKYNMYIERNSVKNAVNKFPLITAILLIYTAIYRYNEEDSNGYWGEFFVKSYNFQRDVPEVMGTMDKIKSEYNIVSNDRDIFKKKNLSKIFANIYLPDISLKKIYSCIYLSNKNKNNKINNIDFVQSYYNKLDIPGRFFIGEDDIIVDAYEKLVELVRIGLQNNFTDIENIELPFIIPNRFIITLRDWYEKDKPKIDETNKHDEFYLSFPKVKMDILNEKIFLLLPKQKNRKLSDERAVWELNLDNKKSFIDTSIIRQSSGNYLMLDEAFELKKYSNIEVSYYYNDIDIYSYNKIKKPNFNFEKEYVLFDLQGNLIKNNILKRNGCIIGIDSEIKFNSETIVNEFQINKWHDYIFYRLDLKSFNGNKLKINDDICFEIEDKPVIERKKFKLAFEEYEKSSFEQANRIYEKYGDIKLTVPYICESQFKLYVDGIQANVDYDKHGENTLIINMDDKLEQGNHYVSIYYKSKNIYSDSFIIYNNFKVINKSNLSYLNEYNEDLNKGIFVEKNSEFNIEATDYTTKIYDIEDKYLIKPVNSSVLKFTVKFENDINYIDIKKIVSPYNISILGLEKIIEVNNNKKITEITKAAIIDTNLRIEVSNLDYNYEVLLYKLEILDLVRSDKIEDTKKLKFGEFTNWNLKNFNDRTMDFQNYSIIIHILNEKQEILHKKELIRITNVIEMLNFKPKKSKSSDSIILSWEEKNLNKKKILKLYNLTSPYYEPKIYDLKEGQFQLSIGTNELLRDMYVPILDYKKEISLFANLENEDKFFTRHEAEIAFFNKSGEIIDEQSKYMTNVIALIKKDDISKNTDKIIECIDKIDFEKVKLKNLFYEILQMKYLTEIENAKELDELGTIYYFIIKKVFNYKTKNQILREVYDLKDELKEDDTKFLVHLFSSFRNNEKIENQLIDDLIDIGLIEALCLVENGSRELTKNIQARCKNDFDLELLQKFTDYREIFRKIEDEIKHISCFWEWISNPKNNSLIKGSNYGNSKDILFRIYESQKNISSYKVLGYTIDNLVSSITSKDVILISKTIFGKNNILKIENDLYENLNKLINFSEIEEYNDILEAAFISVYNPSEYDAELYFKLMFKAYFSKRKNLFDRYRAYFKPIMILRGQK